MSHLVDMFGHPLVPVTYGPSPIEGLMRVAEEYYREQSKREIEAFTTLEPFFPVLYDCNDKPIEPDYKPMKYNSESKYFKFPIESKGVLRDLP